ncbi:MAG: hypothetical protein AAGA17_09400 [Actinomycetota bacterium]
MCLHCRHLVREGRDVVARLVELRDRAADDLLVSWLLRWDD